MNSDFIIFLLGVLMGMIMGLLYITIMDEL